MIIFFVAVLCWAIGFLTCAWVLADRGSTCAVPLCTEPVDPLVCPGHAESTVSF
jgi:hypothetical protein